MRTSGPLRRTQGHLRSTPLAKKHPRTTVPPLCPLYRKKTRDRSSSLGQALFFGGGPQSPAPSRPCRQVLYLCCKHRGTGAQKTGGRLFSYECWQSPTGHIQLQDQDLTCHVCYTPGKTASQSMASLQTSTDGSVRGQGVPLPGRGVRMGMREEQADDF